MTDTRPECSERREALITGNLATAAQTYLAGSQRLGEFITVENDMEAVGW